MTSNPRGLRMANYEDTAERTKVLSKKFRAH
jgi:hypothetical protein